MARSANIGGRGLAREEQPPPAYRPSSDFVLSGSSGNRPAGFAAPGAVVLKERKHPPELELPKGFRAHLPGPDSCLFLKTGLSRRPHPFHIMDVPSIRPLDPSLNRTDETVFPSGRRRAPRREKVPSLGLGLGPHCATVGAALWP